MSHMSVFLVGETSHLVPIIIFYSAFNVSHELSELIALLSLRQWGSYTGINMHRCNTSYKTERSSQLYLDDIYQIVISFKKTQNLTLLETKNFNGTAMGSLPVRLNSYMIWKARSKFFSTSFSATSHLRLQHSTNPKFILGITIIQWISMIWHHAYQQIYLHIECSTYNSWPLI